jgi:hypothetical protein
MADRWEYKIVYVGAERWTSTGLPSDLNENFDAWGAEGWELASTESIQRQTFFSYGSTTVGLVAFFKRRVAT